MSDANMTKNRPHQLSMSIVVNAQEMIGKQVYKKSGKPFKSTEKVNTVSGVTVNPNTNKKAFTFDEDDSIVDCFICREYI